MVMTYLLTAVLTADTLNSCNREALPIPIGLLASAIIFTEMEKSSRLLVKIQNALNSSKVML